MPFDFINPKLPLFINILAIVANILNFIYNVPQVVKTIKTGSVKDFSASFIVLRTITCIMWLIYSIYINEFQMIILNAVTILSSIILLYYKIIEKIENKNDYEAL